MLVPVYKHVDVLKIVSYAELGACIPLNGGPHAYLQHAYGSFLGWLFAWTMIFVVKPVTIAAVALIFGQYLFRIIFTLFGMSDRGAPSWVTKTVGLLCVWIVVGVNIIGARWGIVINSTFTIIKITALTSVAMIGIFSLCLIPTFSKLKDT